MGIASFGFGIPSLPITIVNMVSFILNNSFNIISFLYEKKFHII